MVHYVLAFAFDDLGRVVLIKKQKPAWQAGLLNGVGGKMEEGESPLDAMVREFKEETGVGYRHWDLKGEMLGHLGFRVVVFTATDRIFRDCKTVESEEVVHELIDRVTQRNAIENLPALIQLCLIPVAEPSGTSPTFTLNY